MNKYQLYKQIRQELATGCADELAAVTDLLQNGFTAIGSPTASLDVGAQNSFSSMSEAGRIFREELADAVRLILERYQRNLRKEIVGLGLPESGGQANPVVEANGRHAAGPELDAPAHNKIAFALSA